MALGSAIASRVGELGTQARSLWLLGEIAARSEAGATEGAERRYREALELATKRGMRPLAAGCHLGLGRLYHGMDRGEQAQERLAAARTMYREMGMTFWLEKAEAEMREAR